MKFWCFLILLCCIILINSCADNVAIEEYSQLEAENELLRQENERLAEENNSLKASLNDIKSLTEENKRLTEEKKSLISTLEENDSLKQENKRLTEENKQLKEILEVKEQPNVEVIKIELVEGRQAKFEVVDKDVFKNEVGWVVYRTTIQNVGNDSATFVSCVVLVVNTDGIIIDSAEGYLVSGGEISVGDRILKDFTFLADALTEYENLDEVTFIVKFDYRTKDESAPTVTLELKNVGNATAYLTKCDIIIKDLENNILEKQQIYLGNIKPGASIVEICRLTKYKTIEGLDISCSNINWS